MDSIQNIWLQATKWEVTITLLYMLLTLVYLVIMCITDAMTESPCESKHDIKIRAERHTFSNYICTFTH
jgi:hypothetical protein